MRRTFICSFADGTYRAKSPSGRRSILFEDSNQFGPAKVHPRTAELSEISPHLRWFWKWYPGWRAAGRPTVGQPLSSQIGDIYSAQMEIGATPPAGEAP